MKKTIITRLSAPLWLLIIVMAIPLKASAIEESQVIPLKAIKSTGEQSLNTGYTHKANTRIVLDCEVTKNTQRNWEALFGARLGDYGKNAFCFFSRHWNHTNSATDGACYNRSGEETNGSNFVYGERIKLVAEGKTATWYKYSNLNTAFGSVTTGGTANDGKTPMFLFDLNTSGSVGGTQDDNSKSVMTLYSCKIYEGSTLMCDFVPAKYNNTVGLYDRVNKTFHGSRTDKPFTAIEKTSSDATFMNLDESQVTLLDAIKSTGEQAFNTGYTHKANTRMELDCNVTKNSQREWEALFGARLKNFSSNAFCFFSRHNKTGTAINGPCFNRSGVETIGTDFVYDERIKLVAEGKTATWYKYSDLSTTAGIVTTSGTADDGKTPMFLFNLNTSDAVGGTQEDSSPSVMTLYGCKIYEGSTLKCDFVPAKYNDVVGLYDRVNKTFSGSLTDKPFTAIEFPDASIQADYERAVNTIKDGKYRIFTMVGTQKYYLTADGKLSTNVNNAPQFTFTKVTPSSTEREYEKSFYVKNGSYYFSNSSKEDGSALSEGHICTSTSGRDTWESQVFFLNTEGKYAIRSTNAKSGSSGWGKVGTAFWTVSSGSNGPVAQYSYNMNYVWQIEDESESSETIPGTELLTNGKCDGTYTGWTKSDGGSGWGIGNDNGVKYWVSSNGLCTLSQTVSLSDFSIDATRIDNNFVTFIASAKMKTPSKNNNSGKGASANSIIVYMLDANGSSIGMETVFNDLSYYENWTTIKSNPITLVPGTRKLMYRVTGQDAAYLSGQHGPAYRDLSLKVSVDTDSPIPDPDPITVTSGTVDWTNGTYNVTSDVTIERRVQVYGDVTLNLGEGCTLTAMKGIGIFYDSNTPAGTLTINGPGTLIAGATDNNAGIGGNGSMTEYGCITINGGTITARGGMYAAGIGGGKSNINRHQSSITINGGVVTAIGGDGGAGIGGGYREPTGNDYGLSGDIIINGGQVTATGGTLITITRVQAPGIGRGYRATGNCGTLTLGWTNATDFIVANGGFDEFNIRFVEGKEFVFEGTPTVVTASNLHSYIKKLVPKIPKPEGLAIDATNFPDEAFRNYLLSQDYGLDGVITPQEIKNITSIGVAVTANNQQPIQSLQGIEFFTALDSLNCDNNQLTELDLSSNTVLRDLHCNANQLTTLTLPESTTLQYLFCGGNKLTTLDLSKNPNLFILYFCSNQIKDAGMDALVASLPTREGFLKGFFEVIDATDKNEGNKMTTAQVEAAKQKGWNPTYLPKGSNQWQEYAGSDATPEGIAIDATNFPDEVFRNYLLGQSYGEDGVITPEEIQNITNIDFIVGKVIEFNPGDIIIAGGSRSLHPSKQERVTVSNYQPIQSLQGIEFFTALKHLNCIKNQLTTLDLSSNTALETLICEYNQLTTLKLPESTTLKTVSCYKNQLATLDVSKNTALETLYCDDNQLTTLDLSHNTNLLNFSCYSNQIKDAGMDALVTSLPTKQDADDARFYVVDATDENEGNVMTTAQVEAAKQKGWEIFYWRSDDDEWQEYAGSDAAPEGIAIDATNFPDETFRNYLLSLDYGQDGVITPKEIETIRDMNVQKYDDDDDDDDEDAEESRSLQKSRYQSKQKRILASDQQPIQSLQGIEFFTALKYLTCDNNQLTTLDLSKNTALEFLSCANNQLTALTLPESTTLNTLSCEENQLTTLDLSKNTALETLFCEYNQLTTLDVSKNTALEFLSCAKNQLTTLMLPEGTTLNTLFCSENQLTMLDLSKSTALQYVYCAGNKLTTLDLSKNTDLKEIVLCSNQIKDAGMDALVASLLTKQDGDKAFLTVIDAADKNEGNVMTTTQVEAAKQKGWKVYYSRSDDDDDWQEYAGSTPIVTYPVWVGETQVTENNMNDVLGDGKVTYTPGNNTGTLKFKSNTTINGSHASAKIYVDGIDLVINAPKGIVLENSTLGISMGGENRKLTVNGDITIKVFSPAINNCQELTINGNLTVESRTPIYCKSITVNGNVKVTGSTTGLNAPTIVLNGTKHEFNTSYPCISADGAVTITGDLTATANDRPVISAKGGSVVTLVSGTWTLDGGNYPAIELEGNAQLVIPSTHAIVEPENAQMKTFTGRNPYTTIADADGNAATHVVIAPHHVHSMKETTGKGATCTEPGFETYWTCTSCNKMFSDEQGENEISAPREIPATGHIWGEWVVTREATTTQEGEETRTCLNDPSHKETRPIPVLESGIAIDETNFPDANFRQFVLDNYDKKSNKLLSDEEIAAVTRMDIDEKEIADLTGIEYFTALQSLACQNNQLKALDLSKNTALQSLACQNNQLKALDLSKNTELHLLGCGDNQLTALDLSKNTKLITLDCYLNQINGKAMDALIESLPQVTDGDFYAISTVNDKEQNVITKSQVAAAKAKGWTVYDRTEKPGFTYEEYEGSSDPVPDGIRNAMNGNGDDDKLYNLQGRRVERVAKKGVFIKNGKKVIRK